MGPRKISPSTRALIGTSVALIALALPATAPGAGYSAEKPPAGPRIIGVGSPGEVVRKYVLQIQLDLTGGGSGGTAFGYFTFVPGAEDTDLFSDNNPSRQNESTARFSTFSSLKPGRITLNGPLIIFSAEGTGTAYFNPTPRGTFSDGESFTRGTVIAMTADSTQFIFDTLTGSGSGVVSVRETRGDPFMLNGELVQFGSVGAKFTVFMQGKFSLFHGLTRLYAAGHIIQVQ